MSNIDVEEKVSIIREALEELRDDLDEFMVLELEDVLDRLRNLVE